MSVCYLCGSSFSVAQNSVEHIIPNSVGGKLKSKRIVCATCNKHCGQTLDKAFAEVGNIFASKLMVKRDRKGIPTLIATKQGSNEKVLIEPGWIARKLEPKIIREGNKISIQAGTRKRLLQEFERLKKSLALDGYTIVDEIIPERKEDPDKQMITFEVTVNKDNLLRAFAKIIASYYYHLTNDLSGVNEIAAFIRKGAPNDYAWFFSLQVNNTLFPGENNHVIAIRGSREEKVLTGYFELFAAMGVLCVLCKNYIGEDFKASYLFNPVTGTKKDFEIDYNIPAAQILDLIRIKPEPSQIRFTSTKL